MTGISAEMTLQDSQSSEEFDLELYGVYNMQIGQAIMTTTSSKMAGIFMLPHFTLSEHTFESTRKMLNESIAQTIRSQKTDSSFSLNPWSSNVEDNTRAAFEAPQCEVILYLQQLPPSGSRTVAISSAVLAFLEREMRFPTGAFLPSAPELRFSMLAFSPDCGYVLESKGEPDFAAQDGQHLPGPKSRSCKAVAAIIYWSSPSLSVANSLCSCAKCAKPTHLLRGAESASTQSLCSRSGMASLASLSCLSVSQSAAFGST